MFAIGPNETLTLRTTLRNILGDVSRIVPTEGFAIVGLHIIPKGARPNEDQPQLTAVTSTGARLYFSKQRYMIGMEPDSLQLVHVRLPPQNLRQPPAEPVATLRGGFLPPAAPANGAPFAIRHIEGSTYSAGVTLARQGPIDDPEKSDDIICISPDLAALTSLPAPTTSYNPYSSYSNIAGPPRAILTEYASVMTISGNAWAMCEVPSAPISKKPSEGNVSNLSNELVTQFSQPRRAFLIVTNTGLNIVVKRRAVDFLSASLIEEDMGNQGPAQDFFTSFGRDQTCSMLFALAAGNTFLSSDVGPAHANSIVANAAKSLLFSQSGKPVFRETVGLGGGMFMDISKRNSDLLGLIFRRQQYRFQRETCRIRLVFDADFTTHLAFLCHRWRYVSTTLASSIGIQD